mgnify:CR=1 FL=1
MSEYLKIKEIVIEQMKAEAQRWAKTKTVDWSGDGYFTARQLKKAHSQRDKIRDGSKLILEGFKKLGY